MDKDRNFDLQQVTYGPLKQNVPGILNMQKVFTLSSRDIKFIVTILIGHGCELVHRTQPNGGPTTIMVLLKADREPVVTIFQFQIYISEAFFDEDHIYVDNAENWKLQLIPDISRSTRGTNI